LAGSLAGPTDKTLIIPVELESVEGRNRQVSDAKRQVFDRQGVYPHELAADQVRSNNIVRKHDPPQLNGITPHRSISIKSVFPVN
jgi:hypothetical protein